MKRALVLGPGQDGSFLVEILLERGYSVHVMHRRSSSDNLWRIRPYRDRVTLHRGDMTDAASLHAVLRASRRPYEIYCTADQDDISWSVALPSYSFDVTAGGPMRLLEAVAEFSPASRVFLPISITVFGDAPPPQNETTPLNPQSPFAVAKAAAWHLARYFRTVRGLYVSCAILGNHDSPTRSADYVLHKICREAVRIRRQQLDGKNPDKLVLGSLEQRIDIGYARDYMEAAVDILQLPEPDDFVIGTGEAWSIGEMVQTAFSAANVSDGEMFDWLELIEVNPAYCRPGPQPTYVADTTKAREAFGFNPPTSIDRLIKMLVEHEQEKSR